LIPGFSSRFAAASSEDQETRRNGLWRNIYRLFWFLDYLMIGMALASLYSLLFSSMCLLLIFTAHNVLGFLQILHFSISLPLILFSLLLISMIIWLWACSCFVFNKQDDDLVCSHFGNYSQR
jgi:hypothetical protein